MKKIIFVSVVGLLCVSASFFTSRLVRPAHGQQVAPRVQKQMKPGPWTPPPTLAEQCIPNIGFFDCDLTPTNAKPGRIAFTAKTQFWFGSKLPELAGGTTVRFQAEVFSAKDEHMVNPLAICYSRPIVVPRDRLIEETVPFDMPAPRGDYRLRVNVIHNAPYSRRLADGTVEEYHESHGMSQIDLKSR